MLTLDAVFARIHRNKLEDIAGDCFLNNEEIIRRIPSLKRHSSAQWLFGIYEDEQKWTVISVNKIFFRYKSTPQCISVENSTKSIFKHFSFNNFNDTAVLDDGRIIWVQSESFAQVFLNILLMLERLPRGAKLL
ncbi:hypothetical protein ACLBWS_17710 [Brucellaceae bacterium D45D]